MITGSNIQAFIFFQCGLLAGTGLRGDKVTEL